MYIATDKNRSMIVDLQWLFTIVKKCTSVCKSLGQGLVMDSCYCCLKDSSGIDKHYVKKTEVWFVYLCVRFICLCRYVTYRSDYS